MILPYDTMLCLLAIACGVGLVGDVIAQWRLTATAHPETPKAHILTAEKE